MKSQNIVMLGLLAAIPVAADQLTFSGQTAGTYDLTAASTWGGVEPSSASELFVTKSGNTFTAPHDFSFTGLYFTSSSITNVIELDEGTTVTVLASGNNVGVKAGYDSPTQNPKFTHTTFKGGKWDLNGTANIAPFYHYSYGKYTNTYVMRVFMRNDIFKKGVRAGVTLLQCDTSEILRVVMVNGNLYFFIKNVKTRAGNYSVDTQRYGIWTQTSLYDDFNLNEMIRKCDCQYLNEYIPEENVSLKTHMPLLFSALYSNKAEIVFKHKLFSSTYSYIKFPPF
jgi:hypothetical protein